MISTWVFFGYSGHLDSNAAAMAAQHALAETMHGHVFEDLIDAGTRTWTGVYRYSEPVEFVLNVRPGMTWRMLAEGITGAQIVVAEGKEFRFLVLIDGTDEACGHGWMRRKGSLNGITPGAWNGTGSNATWPTELEVAEVKAEASGLNV